MQEDAGMKVTSVMDIREMIRMLREGASERAAAEALGVSRNTVSRYRAMAQREGWLAEQAVLPDEASVAEAVKALFAPSAQTVSKLEPHRAWMEDLRAKGVSIAKIHWRLNHELQVPCAYSVVWSYVTQMEDKTPDATVRVETAPGEEAQVDFGYAGRMWDPASGRVRKAWEFVMTLSWSRHQYVQFVFDQTVRTWLQLHRAAFEFFGGVPARIKLDNLKAAVVRASVEDPQIQRAYREMAEHYGFLISPCRPRTPQHKGKVEAGVKYVASSFLAGTDYRTPDRHIGHANADVLRWVLQEAGQRVHGTTRQRPLAQFEQVERASLRTLPEERYELATWTQAKAQRDGYITVEGRYYSVPFRCIGQHVDVRVTERTVQVYAEHALVATHSRAASVGQRVTNPAHLPPHKMPGLQGHATVRERAAGIGPYTAQAIALLLEDAVVDRHSSAQRLVALADRHSQAVLERACQHAFECGDPSPQTIRNMLKVVTSGHADSAPHETIRLSPAFARGIEELAPMHALNVAMTVQPTMTAWQEKMA
jgi:transposase